MEHLTSQTVKIKKSIYVEYKDSDGNKQTGKLITNDGYSVTVMTNQKRIRLSRKEIKFIKE